ncbi:MAG: hypothetical protein AAF404_15950 [Pseudomonadota bacterium]
MTQSQNPLDSTKSTLISVLAAASLCYAVAGAGTASAGNDLPKCLYISSYHSGYDWSDGVENGVRKTLLGECELRQFDMDTKRKRSPEEVEAAVRRSIKIIESWRPDVVITSDDNAAKHLIVPHYSQISNLA